MMAFQVRCDGSGWNERVETFTPETVEGTVEVARGDKGSTAYTIPVVDGDKQYGHMRVVHGNWNPEGPRTQFFPFVSPLNIDTNDVYNAKAWNKTMAVVDRLCAEKGFERLEVHQSGNECLLKFELTGSAKKWDYDALSSALSDDGTTILERLGFRPRGVDDDGFKRMLIYRKCLRNMSVRALKQQCTNFYRGSVSGEGISWFVLDPLAGV